MSFCYLIVSLIFTARCALVIIFLNRVDLIETASGNSQVHRHVGAEPGFETVMPDWATSV